MANPCPDFDLAPLERFDPGLLLSGKNSTDAFVLMLALAFNDLKDENWTRQQLDNCTPDDMTKIDATVGQWQGMRIQFTRHVLAILHELLIAIEAGDHHGRRASLRRAAPEGRRGERVDQSGTRQTETAVHAGDPIGPTPPPAVHSDAAKTTCAKAFSSASSSTPCTGISNRRSTTR
jgi:hypothetical protein